MKIKSEILIEQLYLLTEQNITDVKHFKKLSLTQLNNKQNKNSWSILECIEHLNRYSDFYLPEITHKINKTKHTNTPVFLSSWLGNYFANTVAYKKDLKPMKTFRNMNPNNAVLNKLTLDKFLEQQLQLLILLEQAKNVNLDKTKTSISISKLIKLKLGDTFKVLIYHNQRHIEQAKKLIN